MPTPSSESTLGPDDRRRLLEIARASIEYGLRLGVPMPVDPDTLPSALRPLRATFVTLKRGGELRGCIGHLEAVEPLARDVAENAYAAAFRDARFPPLTAGELERLQLEISILTPPEALPVANEEQLLALLEPGLDGLILDDGRRRGTFLPAVWEMLPERREFVRALKRKAGLDADYWSPTLRVYRYRTESFPG